MWDRITHTMEFMKPDVLKWTGAVIGAIMAWWTGLTAIAQALLLVQGADILTGILCAVTGKSPKSQSGRVSAKALTMGVIKKGLEWLVAGICIRVGGALEMDGIGGAAMTYMIATELFSLLENLQIFGLDIPVLRRILDVAQGDREE